MLIAFALTMAVSVVLSAIMHRTILSSTILFFVAGICVGPDLFDVFHPAGESEFVGNLAMIALFTVLVADGSRVALHDVRANWALPTRTLAFGIPLTIVFIALVAHFTVGLDWLPSFLLGAVLSPTDPVLASAIVGRERVPHRVRLLLNIESGANDGLALPAVVVLATFVTTATVDPFRLALEIPGGIVIGVVIPWLLLRVAYSRAFGVSERAEPLAPASAAVLVFALAQLTGANLYLAAFAAGITIGNTGGINTEGFRRFVDPLSEVAKVTALFAFGALITWSDYVSVEPLTVFVFAAVVLFVVRPAVVGITMIRSGLSGFDQAIAGWFGPRGFASVIYALYVLNAGGPDAPRVFALAALVVAGSILLHSSTDVVAIRILRRRSERASATQSEPGVADGRRRHESAATSVTSPP